MRPMNEAPKDGTAILIRATDPVYAEHGWVIAFWSGEKTGDTAPEDAGWYRSEADSSGHRLFQYGDRPLGWMPLPEASPRSPIAECPYCGKELFTDSERQDGPGDAPLRCFPKCEPNKDDQI